MSFNRSEIVKKIALYEEDCLELEYLIDDFVELLKSSDEIIRYNHIYDIIDYLIGNQLLKIVFHKLYKKIPSFGLIINNISKSDITNIFYDGYDIGNFVKYKNNIFKVIKRNFTTIYDAEDNSYDIDKCDIMTKHEVRKYKLSKIL